jgi:hypothetical protein
MFCMLDSKAHSTRKRMLSHVYAKSNVLSSPTIRENTRTILFDRLLPIMAKSAETGTPVDVHKLNYSYAMDSFMAFQVGLKLGSNFIQNIDERERYLSAFFSRRSWFFWPEEMPNLKALLEKIGIRLVPKWADEATDALADWNLRICDEAEKMLSSGKDIPVADYPAVYAHQRAALRKWNGPSFNPIPQAYPYRLDIASDTYDHNAAAHETSGDTLTWLYYELSRRPGLQARLRKELLTLDPPIHYPPLPGSELPDFKAVDNLPVLDAILQETLRLWTAVPGGQPRSTPPGGCSLAGYDNIPAGVRVMCAAYNLHRNPDVFPNPETFDPDRWLNATPEQLTEMRHWFWAWGSGGRMCIGLHFATHCE